MGSPDSPDLERMAPTLPVVGDVVAGKYRVERIIARGGMGVVYAAHHMFLDQRVALKVMLVGQDAPNVEVIERFVREAQAAARLQSEHVVRVMDVGALDHGAPFLVLEYLQGCDLEELLRLNGPLDTRDLADYILQATAALAQAHAADIIHRDIKPANIFLAVRADGTNVIKVVDFGISKQPSNRARWRKLTGEASLGTPAYMSPEQLRSSQGVDPRADVWSLGVLMYELLTGRIPFDGEGPGAVFAAILEKDPDPIRMHRPDVSVELEAVVFRCLQRKKEDRFADVGELARQLVVHGSGRWDSLIEGIDQALARSSRSDAIESGALEAAASAIAMKSLPPPGALKESGSITISFEEPRRVPTIKDDPTLKDPVAGLPGRVSGGAGPWPRRARVGIGAAALAILAAVALREVRGAQARRAAPAVVAAEARAPVPASAASDVEGNAAAPSPSGEGSPEPSPMAPSTSTASGPAPEAAGAVGKRPRPPKRPSFLRSRE
jgi:serine/threonine-protein kinase